MSGCIEIKQVGEEELIMFHVPRKQSSSGKAKVKKPRKTRSDKGKLRSSGKKRGSRPQLKQVIIDPETGVVTYE